MIKINISGLEKAVVVKALYDNSIPFRMGIIQHVPGRMSAEEASFWAQREFLDYIHGRYMKAFFGEEGFVIIDEEYNKLAEYYESEEGKMFRDVGILTHRPLPAEDVIAKLRDQI